jgi:hypothetical protein
MGKVISFLDLLRKKSRAHAALKSIFDHPPSMRADATSSDWADMFLERLWLEGFKIVPRENKDDWDGAA